jgi:dolichol-phosphate mannosyltransferase
MRVWVVLPAYNEAANLPPVFDGFRKLARDTWNLDLRVILVDDGSTDGTPQAAAQSAQGLNVEVLVNERNMGLAETFTRGLRRAADAAGADDMVVCMDADNSHLPGQVLRLIREIQEGRDVVVVSRYRPGAVVRGVSLPRRILSRGMSVLFRVVYPIKGVRDYSCGYRAYRAGFLQQAIRSQGDDLFAVGDGFACMVRILLRLAKEDAVFGEIPIILRYDRKEGVSKMRVGRTVWRTLRVLLRERFSRR